MSIKNVLFVCSRNEWRSRTAETIFKNVQGIQVKSAGTSASARIRINSQHIDWADLIFVMEDKHAQILRQKYREELSQKELVILYIPDEYKYMDEELIEILKSSCESYWNI